MGSSDQEPTITYNIEVNALPVSANRILNALARVRGTTKRVIVREALAEYAKNHENDTMKIAQRQRVTGREEDR